MIKLNEIYMDLAIKEANKNFKKLEGGPFGACIIKEDQIIAIARNTVLRGDATCHAEINAIRKASKKIKTFDLSGCVIYSTTEPCPMCFSAIHWAKINIVVYGTTIFDAKKAGFNELTISSNRMKTLGNCSMEIYSKFKNEQCKKLLKKWTLLENKMVY